MRAYKIPRRNCLPTLIARLPVFLIRSVAPASAGNFAALAVPYAEKTLVLKRTDPASDPIPSANQSP